MTAIDHEPDIRPNLSRAGLAMTLTIIYCLVFRGFESPAEIYRYLEARGSKFDRESIEFLIDAYEGDNPEYHLWCRNEQGRRAPLLGVDEVSEAA
ncbi:hypothetical protein [Sphingomonas sp. RS2018]